jgi:hypothetical protein
VRKISEQLIREIATPATLLMAAPQLAGADQPQSFRKALILAPSNRQATVRH